MGNNEPSVDAWNRLPGVSFFERGSKMSHSSSDERYQRLFDLVFDDRQWFRLPYALVRELTWAQAIMLSFLINESYWIRAHERRRGNGHKWRGWFYCTADRVQKLFKIPERTQRHTLKQLRDLGFIAHDLRGVPPKRYFRLRTTNILNFLAEKNPPEDTDGWEE